jgi:hypothetical protein
MTPARLTSISTDRGILTEVPYLYHTMGYSYEEV